jgi:valyl-tRNA synthetase
MLDKRFKHQDYEDKIYKKWEEGGYFKPEVNPDGEPYCIVLPLPNANDPLHMGHALFVIEDILIRYNRMLGKSVLWLPGGDHAGIETQFVFEKKLKKEGKSRFDFDRETLFKMISEYVEENKDVNKNQMRKLGFSLDWSRYHYSLEPEIVEKVKATFRQMHEDKLIYRAERLVNFCPKCGTAFSDLEVKYEEKQDKLYYLDYGTVKIATTRPETIFADTAVAVHPEGKYKNLVGKMATIPLIKKQIPIIADEVVDQEFGTGAVKVTPAHDETDYEIGKRHDLESIKVIDLDGRMINLPEKYVRMKVVNARPEVVMDLKESGKLVEEKKHVHNVGTCYRCHNTIEPTLMPQWYLKTKDMAEKAMEAVKKNETKIFPLKRFEKMYFDWLEKIRDWNISRQIVWGPRIPANYCLDCNPEILINFIDKNGEKVSGKYEELREKYNLEEIKKGLQTLIAPTEANFFLEDKCPMCDGNNIIGETDTFDTWFLSGQWPMNSLGYPDSEDFKKFYPTAVLDTLWDILFFWVARMMMLGIYRTGKVPFKTVHIHSRVVDRKGAKMSKSKGNVINPLEMVEKYGADALRMAMIFGVAPGSDIAVSDEKIKGMRNFANKLWNIARFIENNCEGKKVEDLNKNKLNETDKEFVAKVEELVKLVSSSIENYRFSLAAEGLYEFIWHELADKYIEESKERINGGDEQVLAILTWTLKTCVKLLHPFMPYVTEAIWQEIKKPEDKDLMVSTWGK